jgi:hypothetical protein
MTKKSPSYHVYVVLLNSDVWDNEKKFREENPNAVPGNPCLYVGQTGKTPEERFQDHLNGYKSSKYVRKYGQRLALEFLERDNPMTYEESVIEESRLGQSLRDLGYATWWN